VFVGDSEPIGVLAFSPDGRTLAGALRGRQLRLWNVATGRELLTFHTGLSGNGALEFSSDGSALALSGEDITGRGEVIVWQTGD
jgi:WD40 repeat protein